MEPSLPDGALKTARKGVAVYSVVTVGQASHAGADHANGINAIEEMAHQVLAMQAFTDYERGSTVSIGKISGGTRPNVVPDECRAIVDIRVETSDEGDRLQDAMKALQSKLKGARVVVTGGLERPPMPRTSEIDMAYRSGSPRGKHWRWIRCQLNRSIRIANSGWSWSPGKRSTYSQGVSHSC